MTTIKLSTGDYIRHPGDIEDITRTAFAAFHGIHAMVNDGVRQKDHIPLDGAAMIEGLYALSAMIIDAVPEVQTQADRSAMAEDGGARILAYLQRFRESYEASGQHAIESLGSALHRQRSVQ